jgi:hypothetical protein
MIYVSYNCKSEYTKDWVSCSTQFQSEDAFIAWLEYIISAQGAVLITSYEVR